MRRKYNIDKWRVIKGPMGEWLLYPPYRVVPLDGRTSFEKAQRYFPIVAKTWRRDAV